jgi:YHS domain-containing protein
MLKQLALIICLITLITFTAFAQDQPQTQMQQESKAWNKVCPACGMPIDAKLSTVEYNDKEWGFCSNEHAAQFKQDPEALSANVSEDGAKFVGRTEEKEE